MRIILENAVHGTWTSLSTSSGVTTTRELGRAKVRLCDPNKCRCGGLHGETQYFHGDAPFRVDYEGRIVRFTRIQDDG